MSLIAFIKRHNIDIFADLLADEMFKNQYLKVKVYLLIVPTLILLSCSDPISTSSNPFSILTTYNLGKVVAQKPDSVFLSSICSSLTYIPLETSDSSLIGQITKVAIDDSLIFIFEKDERILLFGKKGNLIRQIGSKSKLSDGYSKPNYFELDQKNDLVYVYDDDSRSILIFDYHSNLKSKTFLKREYFQYFIPFYDDNLLAYTMKPFTLYNEGYNIALISKEGEISSRLLNRHEVFNEKEILAVGINKLYLYKDTISLWQYYYDTIYRILPDKRLIPRYSFNLGSTKMSLSYWNSIKFKKNSQEFTSIRDLIEIGNFFFLRIVSNGELKQLVIRKSDSSIKQISNSPIKNDLDNRMDFWPNGIINDSTLYMALHPVEILESYRLNPTLRSLNNPFYLKLKSVSLNENPWIILATIKQMQ